MRGAKKNLSTCFFLLIFFGCALHVYASVSNGTIDPTAYTAQVCEVTSCTVSATSPVNFGFFTTESAYNVTITDTELRGYIWGTSFGWVVLNCADTTSGCSSTNGNFKVANTTNGTLSGYAWGDTAGWINFGPFTNSATPPITINANGQFNGYAWSQNFGWIEFDCSDPNYCVQTDWRPLSARTITPIPPPVVSPPHGGGRPVPWPPVIPTPPVTQPTNPVIPVTPPSQMPTEPPTSPGGTTPSSPSGPKRHHPNPPIVVQPSTPPVTPFTPLPGPPQYLPLFLRSMVSYLRVIPSQNVPDTSTPSSSGEQKYLLLFLKQMLVYIRAIPPTYIQNPQQQVVQPTPVSVSAFGWIQKALDIIGTFITGIVFSIWDLISGPK